MSKEGCYLIKIRTALRNSKFEIRNSAVRCSATMVEQPKNNHGMSLMEVMVAMLLLAMVASMVYSILDRSIVFAGKGEAKIAEIEKSQALLSLIQRQVRSGWYDVKQKKVVISGEDDILRLVTKAPLLYPDQGTVLAIYRFDRDNQALYYTEKKDFYNPESLEALPESDEMILLLADTGELELFFDEERGMVSFHWQEKEYEFWPWCTEKGEDE